MARLAGVLPDPRTPKKNRLRRKPVRPDNRRVPQTAQPRRPRPGSGALWALIERYTPLHSVVGYGKQNILPTHRVPYILRILPYPIVSIYAVRVGTDIDTYCEVWICGISTELWIWHA